MQNLGVPPIGKLDNSIILQVDYLVLVSAVKTRQFYRSAATCNAKCRGGGVWAIFRGAHVRIVDCALHGFMVVSYMLLAVTEELNLSTPFG